MVPDLASISSGKSLFLCLTRASRVKQTTEMCSGYGRHKSDEQRALSLMLVWFGCSDPEKGLKNVSNRETLGIMGCLRGKNLLKALNL